MSSNTQPSAPKSTEFSYEPPPPYPGVADDQRQRGTSPSHAQFSSYPPPLNFPPQNDNFVQQGNGVVFVDGHNCPMCHVSECVSSEISRSN